MSKISRCRDCGGNIVEPAFPGDGVYPVYPMCSCGDQPTQQQKKAKRPWEDDDDER